MTLSVEEQAAVTEPDGQGKGVTAALAGFAAALRYEDLPADVRHQAKRILLDTLACIVAAQPYDAADRLRSVFAVYGGPSEATVPGTSLRLAAPNAAYVNGELANLLDLDDNLLNHTHFANTAVSSPLAMAERRQASGRDVITAVIAAYEVDARLTLAISPVVKIIGEWPHVSTERHALYGMGFGVFGAAAGAGNVLGLSPGLMSHAFGLAGYSAPVSTNGRYARNEYIAMKKYAAYGHIASCGIVAADLAAAGFTGDTEILDGDYGFWRLVGATECNWPVMTGELGSRWWSLETTFKVYPVCTWDRQPVEAMQLLMREHAFEPDEIDEIVVGLHPAALHPLWLQTRPQTYLDTQMSYPYAIAMAVLDVAGPLWQQPQTISDPRVRRLMDRVSFDTEPEALRAYYEQMRPGPGVRRVRRSPARVTVRARGEVFTQLCEYAKGDPYTDETRLTDDELRAKFVEYGELALPRDALERAADAILALDDLPEIGTLTAMLRVGG